MFLRFLALLVLTGSLGCEDRTPTQLVFQLSAEESVERISDELIVGVYTHEGEEILNRSLPVDSTGVNAELPIVPAEGDPERSVTVRAELRSSFTDTTVASVEASAIFVPGELHFVDLVVEDACLGVVCDKPGQTCHRGQCVGACYATDPGAEASSPACGTCQVCMEGHCVDEPEGTACGCPGDECRSGRCEIAKKATLVGANLAHTCAVAGGAGRDEVYCWGQKIGGVLGVPTADIPGPGSAKLLRVVSPTLQESTRFVSLSVGSHHVCVVDSDGRLFCWGDGDPTQEIVDETAPTEITWPAELGATPSFAEAAVGAHHTCARTFDGSAYCWGSNEEDQVGLGGGGGDLIVDPQPVKAIPAEQWASIDAGRDHTCGVATNGEVFCWGGNLFAQLGTATEEATVALPLNVAVPSALTIDSSVGRSCIVSEEGPIWCWGLNFGEPRSQAPPEQWSAFGTGGFSTCGITPGAPGGALWCWGAGASGELGNGSFRSELAPTPVPGFDDWVQVSVGLGHTCAVRNDGSLWCWGLDRIFASGFFLFNGRLGLGPLPTDTVARPHRVCIPD